MRIGLVFFPLASGLEDVKSPRDIPPPDGRSLVCKARRRVAPPSVPLRVCLHSFLSAFVDLVFHLVSAPYADRAGLHLSPS